MTWLQNDVYAGRDDALDGVGYPASPILMNESVAVGAGRLGEAVATTKGPKSLVGVSQGSLLLHEQERRIMDNITETTNTKGGRTTSYLVPTKELPLTKPLRQLGVDHPIVDEVDKHLRPVIDSGYERNDPKSESDGNDARTTADDDDSESDTTAARPS